MKTQEQKIEDTEYLDDVYNLSPVSKEPYFSRAPCLCCDSNLAGMRYEFTGTAGKKHTNTILYLNCCVNCFEYFFT